MVALQKPVNGGGSGALFLLTLSKSTAWASLQGGFADKYDSTTVQHTNLQREQPKNGDVFRH